MLPKDEPYIVFADPVAEEFCATAFGDGVGLTKRKARKVTTSQFNTALAAFADRTSITSFDEFRHFVHVTETGTWTNCTQLTSIKLPPSCYQVTRQAFSGCTSLAYINLDRITKIRYQAFLNCTSLQIDVDMPRLSDLSQSVGLEYETFRNSGITKVTNLGTVSDIGQYSFFSSCTNVTEIWLPSTIKSISRLSMYNCTSLTSLVVLATNPPDLAYSDRFPTIGGAPGRKIYVPYSADHSILDAYKIAENWTIYANDIYELNPDGTVPTEL